MDAVRTTQEACAREIELMGRGHVAHEQGLLIRLATCIRALPASKNRAEAVLDAAYIATVIQRELVGHERLLMSWAVDRIIGVSRSDPMEPFSDRDMWWPRARRAA